MRFKKKLSEHDYVLKNKSNIMKNEIMEDFLKPLYDDLNTPRALAVLNGWFDKLKKNDFPDDLLIQLINKALNILGFDLKKENISGTIVDENKEKK